MVDAVLVAHGHLCGYVASWGSSVVASCDGTLCCSFCVRLQAHLAARSRGILEATSKLEVASTNMQSMIHAEHDPSRQPYMFEEKRNDQRRGEEKTRASERSEEVWRAEGSASTPLLLD